MTFRCFCARTGALRLAAHRKPIDLAGALSTQDVAGQPFGHLPCLLMRFLFERVTQIFLRMAVSTSTELLIAKSSAGDDGGRSESLNMYRERIKFLVRVRLGSKLRLKLDSSDIVQDVFAKGLQNLAEEPNGAGLKQAFLQNIARNVRQVICDRAAFWNAAKRDFNRERPIHHAIESGNREQIDIPDPKAEAPIDRLQVAEDVEQLVQALAQMSADNPEYGELLVALRIEGRSIEDVAREKDLTTGAIKMKTNRAMLKLLEFYRFNDNKRT